MDGVVDIDSANTTGTLYALPNSGASETGIIKYPDGSNDPVMVNEKVATPPFKVLEKQIFPQNKVEVISVDKNDDLGPFLANVDETTPYPFSK